MLVRRILTIVIGALTVRGAIADVAPFEARLLERREAVHNLYVEVHTTVTHFDEGVAQTPRQFVDRYWIVDEYRRRDDFFRGQLDGLCHRYINTPTRAMFFTNESNNLGGDNVVEIRTSPERIPDVRLLGTGVGLVRQGQGWPLILVGQSSDAKRVVSEATCNGEACHNIKYTKDGVGCTLWLAKSDLEPRRFTLECTTPSGELETHEVEIELQTVRAAQGPVRFPKRVAIRSFVDGQLTKRTSETVEQIDLDFSDTDMFQLASLGIPVGHPVYDFRRGRSEQGIWTGERVEFGDTSSATPTEATPRLPRLGLYHYLLAASVICLAAAWFLHRRLKGVV